MAQINVTTNTVRAIKPASAPSTSVQPTIPQVLVGPSSSHNVPAVPAVTKPPVTDVVGITVNGKKFNQTVDPSITLMEFLRRTAMLPGTKHACGEGGCGACAVLLSSTNPLTNEPVHRSINSCLRPAVACNGMSVTTIEGLGSAKTGYHPIQERLALNSGTQCGFCSPGWVMSMYGLLVNNPSPTAAQVEKALDGNLCRCTGYRPILDTAKSFSVDFDDLNEKNPKPNREAFDGIHHMPLVKHRSPVTSDHLTPISPPEQPTAQLQILKDGQLWIEATTTTQLQGLLKQYGSASYRLCVGNTAVGVEKYLPAPTPQVIINIANIPDFHHINVTNKGLDIGAAVTVAKAMDALEYVAKNTKPTPDSYLMLIKHFQRVAGQLVRNAASVAGNLMLTHHHQTAGNSFPSDVAISLFGIGATITIVDVNGVATPLPVEDFLATDMKTKYIASINIPLPSSTAEVFRSYKTAMRHVNAHAIVNAAMRATVDPATKTIVRGSVTLAFGGCQAKLARMPKTEAQMGGMNVKDSAGFTNLAATLLSELGVIPEGGRVAYRQSLSVGYLYKFFLALQGDSVAPALASAAEPWMKREVSHGSQSWQPNPAEYPVNEGIPKIEGKAQCSGEAAYVDDMPNPAGCAHMAFVLSTEGNATIDHIDISVAQQAPGFIAWIPGSEFPAYDSTRPPAFATTTVSHVGHPLGVIVADSEDHAKKAGKLVKVTYSNIQTPVTDINLAIAQKNFFPNPIPATKQGDVEAGFKLAKNIVSGTVEVGEQAHFHLEQHCGVVVPNEGGLDMFVATQQPPKIQEAAASTTGIAASKIIVTTKRVGGGYGGKLENSAIPASTAAFVANKLGKPVRYYTDITTTMLMSGSRPSMRCDYKLGFDANNRLTAVQMKLYVALGWMPNNGQFDIIICLANLDNCYSCPNWLLDSAQVKINAPLHCSCRGPGWVPSTFFMEHVMERSAQQLGVDPIELKQNNFYQRGETTPSGRTLKYWSIDKIWTQLKQNYTRDDINAFNKVNKWRKRGIALVPSKFLHIQNTFQSTVSINRDGSVEITHGGVEIGQGINTVSCQIAAKYLNIDMSLISVNATNTKTGAGTTGGSTTTQMTAASTAQACASLNTILEPVKAQMKGNYTWSQLITRAYELKIPLVSSETAAAMPGYQIYLAAVVIVEVDILTGETEILRADLIEDTGKSLNPCIDFGQMEGGLVMGLGYYTSEEHKYDPQTGDLINLGTWEYKPLSALDIPMQLNLTMLKDAPNDPQGFMSAKATGEPAVNCGCTVMFAIEDALRASLKERGRDAASLYLNAPAAVQTILGGAQVSLKDLVFE